MQLEEEQKASIVRLLLTPSQAAEFWPFLQRSQEETQVKGLLCTINTARRFSADGNLLLGLPVTLDNDHTLLELQTGRPSKEAIRKIQELLRQHRDETPGE